MKKYYALYMGVGSDGKMGDKQLVGCFDAGGLYGVEWAFFDDSYGFLLKEVSGKEFSRLCGLLRAWNNSNR